MKLNLRDNNVINLDIVSLLEMGYMEVICIMKYFKSQGNGQSHVTLCQGYRHVVLGN